MYNKVKHILIIISIIFPLNLFSQNILTLDKYIELVTANNQEIKAIDFTIDAIQNKILELDMVYSPYLSGSYNYMYDKSGTGFGSTLPTDLMKVNSFNIGAGKKFLTGSDITIGYTNSIAYFDLSKPVSIFNDDKIKIFNGYDIKPFIQFQQSLLRDFKSGLTLSNINKLKALSKSGLYMQLYKKQQILINAQVTYWTVSLSREIISFREASLKRTEKILKWNENRVNLDLADKSDLLQAQAGYKLRELNLQLAKEDEEKACRDFNELIGISSNTISFEVEKISDKIPSYSNINKFEKKGERADVISAKAIYESSEFADKETYYRSLPDLLLTGYYSLHGLDLSQSGALNQVTDMLKPTYMIGISIIFPLDYKTLNKVRKGYKDDFRSSRETLNSTELSAKNNWDQLCISWINIKERFKMANEIKKIQENRVSYEQDRFKKGRSTTFQLLTAENDLDDASLNLYRILFEEIIIYAQSELYNTK